MIDKISILLIENDPREQFIFREVIQRIDSSIDVEHLHQIQQLPDFLFKDQLQRELNRQVIPDLVLVNVDSLTFDSTVFKRIRKHFEFSALPIYLLSPYDILPSLLSIALTCGITNVIKKPTTLAELSIIIQEMIELTAAVAI